MGQDSGTHVAVTFETYEHAQGLFFHGTKAELVIGDELVSGDELVPGHGSNSQEGRVSDHTYVTALYSDGLVERRTADLDQGIARLANALARHGDMDPEDLCDRVLAEVGTRQQRRRHRAARPAPQRRTDLTEGAR